MSKYGGTGLGLVISKHSLEQLAHLLGRHSIPVSATASVIQSRTSLKGEDRDARADHREAADPEESQQQSA